MFAVPAGVIAATAARAESPAFRIVFVLIVLAGAVLIALACAPSGSG